MNIIPVFISLIILNLPNVNVFLRLIAYCNSWTKFMFIIDFVFFLSFKYLWGLYKPKKLLKPIDLQDVFEVFVCLFVLFWFVPSSCSRLLKFGAAFIHLSAPTAQLGFSCYYLNLLFSEVISASLSQSTGGFTRLLVAQLCLCCPLVCNYLCWRQFFTGSS